ncbi:MAG: hypothetical protein IJ086_15285 [Clostridium sp.]|nr:hypothetical protein [Clostridium sp.]MBQ9000039.1 hypothetical protein [Clostridium sp.]
MRKFVDMKELSTDNIRMVSLKCEYEICVEFFENGVGLQDAGCLEAFLLDAGIEFIDANEEYYIYKLNDTTFRVPYEKVDDMYEEGVYDSYLLFDSLEII